MKKSKNRKKDKKKNVRFKFGNSETEDNEIDDSEIEDGQTLTDDSDQDNTVQPNQAAQDSTKGVTNVAVKATLTTEAMNKAVSDTKVQKNLAVQQKTPLRQLLKQQFLKNLTAAIKSSRR